jgi:lysozyme
MKHPIVSMIAYEEGWRAKPYLCSENYPTIGYGFKLSSRRGRLDCYDFELPQTAGDAWLQALLDKQQQQVLQEPLLRQALRHSDAARSAVVHSMIYQMGVQGVLRFRMMLAAMAQLDWTRAAEEMLDSRWAEQTPSRAQRHALQMHTGRWFPGYGVQT